jgi:hypothetical protein
MDTGQHLTRISAVRIIVKPSALLGMKPRGQQQWAHRAVRVTRKQQSGADFLTPHDSLLPRFAKQMQGHGQSYNQQETATLVSRTMVSLPPLTSSMEENHVIKNCEANAPAEHDGVGHRTRCPDVLRIGGGR